MMAEDVSRATPRLAGGALVVLMVATGCGSVAPTPKKAPPPVESCAVKYATAPGWTSSDQSALTVVNCVDRASGLWACNKRGSVFDCFTCKGVKTTYDPADSGSGSLKALGVDDAELTALQASYDTGCVTLVDWDQYEPDATTRQLLCKEAMAGLKVCRNIDGKRQWWTLAGHPYMRRQEAATVGNSKGAAHVLDMPADDRDVLDVAQWPFLACDDLAATQEPGWDLWITVKGAVRTLRVDLIEPKSAASEPGKSDFKRLVTAFTTCAESYGNWE